MSNVKSLIAAAALTLIGGAALAQSGIASTESYSVAQVSQVAAGKAHTADKRTARVAAASTSNTESYSVNQIERVANGFVDSTNTASQASPRVASTAPATVR